MLNFRNSKKTAFPFTEDLKVKYLWKIYALIMDIILARINAAIYAIALALKRYEKRLSNPTKTKYPNIVFHNPTRPNRAFI